MKLLQANIQNEIYSIILSQTLTTQNIDKRLCLCHSCVSVSFGLCRCGCGCVKATTHWTIGKNKKKPTRGQLHRILLYYDRMQRDWATTRFKQYMYVVQNSVVYYCFYDARPALRAMFVVFVFL